MQFRAHLHTVTRHRRLVRSYCLKLGLVWQGLTHDLSKFSPVEFWRGCKYYQGWRSPNDQERLENGVSLAWLHHKGRNRHHFEYWIDYCRREDGTIYIGGCKMPKKYVAEMFCDRIAACRVYQGASTPMPRPTTTTSAPRISAAPMPAALCTRTRRRCWIAGSCC